MNRDEFIAKAQMNILEHGLHIQGVGSSPTEPSFCYTIGNCEKGYPELLLIGNFNPCDIATILNILSVNMIETREIPDGMVKPWEDAQYPVLARKASEVARKKYTILVDDVVAIRNYDVIQIVLCDKEGKYPGDEGINPFFDVPLV